MKMTDAIQALRAMGYTVNRTSKDDEGQPMLVARNGANTLRVYCSQRSSRGRYVERVEVSGVLGLALANEVSAVFSEARVTAGGKAWKGGRP
jgi:Holliday junction resolvase